MKIFPHIVTAAETICGSEMSLLELSEAVVKKFVQITVPSPSSSKAAKVKDGIYLYATEVIRINIQVVPLA